MLVLKTHRYLFLQVLTVFLLFQSCGKHDLPQIGEITSFKIEAQRNSALLEQDLVATISENKILIAIPDGMGLDDVYVTYTYNGAEVHFNDQVLTPYQKIKIEDNATFQVKTKDNRSFVYTVVISKYEDGELLFDSFLIEKVNNPQLIATIQMEVGQDTIYGSLHPKLHSHLVPTFSSTAQTVSINGVVQLSGTTGIDLKTPIVYTLTSSKGFKKTYFLKIEWVSTIPHIYITTDGNAEITSKETYVHANINIDGKLEYESYTGTTGIRGRGNSTWEYPKKPYRLKLDTKASLFGLSAEKDWVLLANYLDGTHMLNAVAMKAGKLLNIPYTNNIVPVELTINGEYKGLYMFTEQVEVESNRINVGNGGVLLELDTYFDEPWKFTSGAYELPVMVKYPDLTSDEELDPIRSQFEQMEALVADPGFPNNSYLDHIDGESIANYLIVYMLTNNTEINAPKSTYIHKTATGKYTMGPIWDFDWAFAYDSVNDLYFTSYNDFIFFTEPIIKGTKFFSKFLSDPHIIGYLQQRWAYFKSNKMDELLAFIDDFSDTIEEERSNDYQVWNRGGADFKTDVNRLKVWLQSRVAALDNQLGGL